MNLQDILPVLNIILVVGLAIGGFFAMRKGYSKEIGEIQERTVTALKEEVAVLTRKVDELATERATQDRVIATIRYALKEYGLRVTITGNFVTLQDGAGKRMTTPVKNNAVVKPITGKANPDDDEGDAS